MNERIPLPKLEQLQLELRGLLDAELHAQEKLESIRIDIEDIRQEIKQELECNYFI